MKVLIAEDDASSALLLRRALSKAGHDVTVAADGVEALTALEARPVDALLTDWMMPHMDGIELVRQVRARVRPVPVIIMVTAVASADAKARALEAGVDDYIAKPVLPPEVVARLDDCLRRRHQPAPAAAPLQLARSMVRPPFVGVCVAASTGGPNAVVDVLAGLDAPFPGAVFVVVHGPAWMFEVYVHRLRQATSLAVALTEDGMRAKPNHVYLAPGDRHLYVEPDLRLRVRDEPPVNFVRPAADPLFISAARAFGQYCVAVVLTGMGRDGSLGAREVATAGGVVLAQDPATAVASGMPETVISLGLAAEVVGLADMGRAVSRQARLLAERLIV